MTAAQRERSALVETFHQVGPDAPTLCERWTTRDLAAHLVVRERRLDATLGSRGDVVTVTGEPQQLLMFVSGRDAVRVEFDGDAQSIAAVQAAPRGL